MISQSFLIGPIGEGLRKDIKPWATPQDSFETLNNAYQFRGRIVRRQGYTLLARLSPDGGATFPANPVMGLKTRELFVQGQQQLIGFDTTSAYLFSSSNFTITPVSLTGMQGVWSGTNFQFFWTINYAGGFWVTNSKPGMHGWSVTLFSGQTGTGNTSQVNVTAPGNFAAVGDNIYFINLSGSSASANNLVFATVTAIDVGANPNVITVLVVPNSQSASFTFTNGAVTGFMLDSTKSITNQDGIRFYADTGAPIGLTWVNYNPPIDPNNVLAGALMLFAYRGYLVFLNTTEGTSPATLFNFQNRARWTQIGTPYYTAPVPFVPNPQSIDPLAARDDLFGRGGATDAPTSEAIVAAEFIRDILVVYFEKSTWRLRFVNNSQNPFVWERVNVELGSDCTFSTIVFDKGLMAIGDRGIVISDGNDTIRFDEKIPDDIFDIRFNNQGLQRVYGIRTFRTKLNFWTYPSSDNPTGIFPDKVLVFNYDTKNWSYFDDCFTCFGYFYLAGAGITWNDLTTPWQDETRTWDSGVSQAGYETIVAGNQQGFVFELEQSAGVNEPSLFISAFSGNIVTSPNNNLPDETWIKITGVTGLTFADGVSLNGRNFKIANPGLDANNFVLQEFMPIGAGNAVGTVFPTPPTTYNIGYVPILPGSVQINVGALQFTDDNLDGKLYVSGVFSGTVDYTTGALVLNFSTPILSTPVIIRIVSFDINQEISPIMTTGTYMGGGLITKISNFDIQSKIFNFFNDDKRSRLSKIDFYVYATDNGQFQCNIFADSSAISTNTPLADNVQSNIVLTTRNPYQVGQESETIFRLFCDVFAQTVQFQFTMSDQQMATDAVNSNPMEINALMVTLKRGGRLP